MSDAPASEPTSNSRSVSLSTVVIIVVLLGWAATVVVAIGQMRRADDVDAAFDAYEDVIEAASTFGEVYLSYDFEDPERSGDRVLDLITPTFAEDFESTRAPAIEQLFSNLGTATTAVTKSVFVREFDEDTAQALVVVDVTATSDASGTQQLTDLAFVLDLVDVDGQWLIDAVNPAPQPDITGDGVELPTTTTTPTTVP